MKCAGYFIHDNKKFAERAFYHVLMTWNSVVDKKYRDRVIEKILKYYDCYELGEITAGKKKWCLKIIYIGSQSPHKRALFMPLSLQNKFLHSSSA